MLYEQITKYVEGFIGRYPRLVDDQCEFDQELTQLLLQLDTLIQTLDELAAAKARAFFRAIAGPVIGNGFLQEYCRQKPYGYAGDFQAIDYILTNHTSTDSSSSAWDRTPVEQKAA